MAAILAGTLLPAFPEAWKGKTPFLSTRIALGSTSQQVQVIIITPAFENEWLFKHTYLLWLASWSHSKSKGMSCSTAKNSRKSLNTVRARLLVLPAGLGPGGQGLQGFAENIANTFKPGKLLFFGPGILQIPDWSPHCFSQKHFLLHISLLFLVVWGTMFLKPKRSLTKGLLGRAHALQSQLNAGFGPGRAGNVRTHQHSQEKNFQWALKRPCPHPD